MIAYSRRGAVTRGSRRARDGCRNGARDPGNAREATARERPGRSPFRQDVEAIRFEPDGIMDCMEIARAAQYRTRFFHGCQAGERGPQF